MTTTGTDDGQIKAAFEELGALENEFADVELDALRRKEHSLTPLYARRAPILQRIPDFWATVFMNAPEEISGLYSSADISAIAAIKDFKVERYAISSETEGEPRSLRFTFDFASNDNFGACTLVKEFEYKASTDRRGGPGALVSKAVKIPWKNKKSDLTKGMLDMAVELEAAEETMKLKKGGEEVELVEREGLWQYGKLREAIEKSEDAGDEEPTFLNWFGFRGAVEKRSETKEANGDAVDEDDEEDDEWDDGLLDVEIFPAGEDLAIALAEDLWPEAIDIWMQANADDEDDDSEGFEGFEEMEEDGDEAPALVKADDEEGAEDEKPPKKRVRTG
ncbi:putative nucleosome assembly protein C36B7.08c [Cyphellophora attinorum]|uniref:Putative nucleosome assembly protein C36B7.08c n=1 Tax=Cyphellophora attinorum TaxID=1664694 RepID=A0A0N0NN61_9EURO|nr:putative nucleosome assembly protein C36B7.08c [Phialophora attinorum]KPI41148.1 putative nucleosome assembly protein C36B7.08c [Phialophora attinorum]